MRTYKEIMMSEGKIKIATKLATAGSEEGIIKLIGEFFASQNISLVPLSGEKDTWEVHNAKGVVNNFFVIKSGRKKIKFTFGRIA